MFKSNSTNFIELSQNDCCSIFHTLLQIRFTKCGKSEKCPLRNCNCSTFYKTLTTKANYLQYRKVELKKWTSL